MAPAGSTPPAGSWRVCYGTVVPSTARTVRRGFASAAADRLEGGSLGLYERRVLPTLIHHGMRQRRLRPIRERALAAARGRVLEIGIGSGLNLPFYPRDLDAVIGLDPSPELLARARREAVWSRSPVELRRGSAEAIPLDDQSVDTVVATWTLCSIPDVRAALGEIRRVLRPGGRFLFAEHGRAPEPAVVAWQDRLTPLWQRIAGGCHLNRPVERLITGSGLRVAELDRYYLPGPKTVGCMYEGIALKEA
jgi:SAM-dependent methyltransferase